MKEDGRSCEVCGSHWLTGNSASSHRRKSWRDTHTWTQKPMEHLWICSHKQPIGSADEIVQFKQRSLYSCSLKAAYTKPMRRTSDDSKWKVHLDVFKPSCITFTRGDQRRKGETRLLSFETSPILFSTLLSCSLGTPWNIWLHITSTSYVWKQYNRNIIPVTAAFTYPGLVKCVVLQSKDVPSLPPLQGGGGSWGQQAGWLGYHGWVWRGGEGSSQREALQLPLSLLLQYLADNHLLLLVGQGRTIRLWDTQNTSTALKMKWLYALMPCRCLCWQVLRWRQCI